MFVAWFRLFVGDLSNDVSDDVLANAFKEYPSFQKARVIRDRLSQKVLMSFDGQDCPTDADFRRSMVLWPFLTLKIS